MTPVAIGDGGTGEPPPGSGASQLRETSAMARARSAGVAIAAIRASCGANGFVPRASARASSIRLA